MTQMILIDCQVLCTPAFVLEENGVGFREMLISSNWLLTKVESNFYFPMILDFQSSRHKSVFQE